MTTVKEFKDLGVEFVTDDKVQWRHGNMAGVISFAWRPLNTLPDNPRFKYEVATDNHSWRPLIDQSDSKPVTIGSGVETNKHSDGTLGYCANKTIIPDMTLKPVFTQAMADAGELPPVGSEVVVSLKDAGYSTKDVDLDYEGKTVTVMAAFKNKRGTDMISVQNDRGACICYTSTCAKPIDTRTPKQKAVDEMCKLWSDSKGLSVKDSFEAIYDAGYRKR